MDMMRYTKHSFSQMTAMLTAALVLLSICLHRCSSQLCDEDNGWKYVNGSCFKMFMDRSSWEQARQECEVVNAELATVFTLEEHTTFFKTAREQNTSVWMGLKTKEISGQMQLSWINGAVLNPEGNVTFWGDNQPGDLENDTCLVIDGEVTPQGASWRMDNCNEMHSFLCEKPQGSCEVGWLSHLGTCFRMFHRKNSWNSSRSFCQQIDAQLVKISSSTDQQFLQSYLQEFNDEGVRSFWIGIGAGMNNSGPLLWTDGSSIGYSFWAQVSESPDTPGMENCAYIDTSDVDGRWQMTTDCWHAKAFVCTIPINTPVRPIVRNSDSSLCHRGWIAHGDSCYYFSTKHKSWSSAQAACLSHRADLVVIRGSDDQSFIKSQIHGTDYWIGLTDNSKEGRWMWVDQSEATYTNWESHAFEVHNADEDCAGIIGTRGQSESGMWKDYICGRKMHYICQKPASKRNQSSTTTRATPKYFTASTPGIVSQKCGAHWEERPNSDYCYQFHARPANYRDAEATCQHNNGTLVSIRDSAEQNFLAGRRLWLSTDSIWIGATDSSMEDGWSWSDGTPFAFINWNPGKPSNSDYRQDCAAMMRDNSRWSDYICTLEKSFVCKKTADTIIPTVPTTVSTFSPRNAYGCPPGWIKYNDHCYSIRDERDTWDGAKSKCRADGAELTSISSEYENDFLASHLPKASLLSVWIGLSNSRRPQTFEWVDDSTVQFTNWGIRQPVMSVLRSCVLFSATKWSTASCDSQLSYVCKKQISVLSRTSLSPFQEGCPANTLAYEAYCYQFMDTFRVNWMTAESTCSAHFQGHLATINDVHVHLALASELQPRTVVSHYWVGLSDVKTPGIYNWSSGESLRYAAWSPLYTGNQQNSCIGIKTSAVAGQWENLDCRSTRPFVCQFPRKGFTTTTTTLAPTTEIPCLYGWTGFRDRCYLPYVQATKSWDEARAICQGYGGDLASIPDKSVNDFVSGLFLPRGTSFRYSRFLEETFWIGLRKYSSKLKLFKWSDGTPFIYAAWMSGEPNTLDYYSVCVEYDQRRKEWNSLYCSTANKFLCSIARDRQMTTTLQPLIDTSIMCNEDGWVYKGGYCYYMSSIDILKETWFGARRFCQTRGADLVSILSADENAFLEKLAGSKFTYTQKLWTGLHRINIDAFEWTDRSPLIYQNWDSGEPNEFSGAEKCTSLYSTHGRWNDDNCQLGMHYICKKANGTKPLAPVPTPTISGGCPPGFSELGNKCYTVGGVNQYQGGSKWADAIFACSNMSSRNKVFLASITSPQEQALVLTLLENSARNAFIGLSNLHTYHTFAWHSGEEVTLTYWSSGMQSHIEKRCVVVEVEEVNFGKWKDVDCNDTYAYVCQTLKDPTYPTEEPPGSGCSSDYLRYGDSCYHTYTRASHWFEAQKICQNDGGNLVSIRDVHELSKVHVLTYLKSGSKPVWIGLFYNKTQYNWVDNVSVTFTKWGQGQPKLHHSGTCASMTDGVWSDVSCSHAKQFVCKTPVDNTSYTILPDFLADVGICENTVYKTFGDYCYYANPHDIVSWSDANIKCKNRKMEMVSIHSQEEQNFLVNLTKELWRRATRSYLLDEEETLIHYRKDDDGGYSPKFDIGLNSQFWEDDVDGYSPKFDAFHQLQKLEDFLLDEHSGDFDPKSHHWSGHPPNSKPWIGLIRDLKGGFQWSDNSPVNFLSWHQGEPNNQGGEDCVELLAYFDKWNDLSCKEQARGYICKTMKSLPSTIAVKPSVAETTLQTPTSTQMTASVANNTTVSNETESAHLNTQELGGGKIAGISISIIIVIIFVSVAVYFARRRAKSRRRVRFEDAGIVNALYTPQSEQLL